MHQLVGIWKSDEIHQKYSGSLARKFNVIYIEICTNCGQHIGCDEIHQSNGYFSRQSEWFIENVSLETSPWIRREEIEMAFWKRENIRLRAIRVPLGFCRISLMVLNFMQILQLACIAELLILAVMAASNVRAFVLGTNRHEIVYMALHTR